MGVERDGEVVHQLKQKLEIVIQYENILFVSIVRQNRNLNFIQIEWKKLTSIVDFLFAPEKGN